MALVAIPNIPPLVIPPATPASVQLVSTITGTGPWDWTGLNGDAAGLVEYRLVVSIKRAVMAGFTLGLRFNNDSGVNYYTTGGGIGTSIPAANSGGLAINNLAQGTIVVPVPKSGSYRVIAGQVVAVDDGPDVSIASPNGAWTSTAAITQITLVVTAGGVDSSSISLYKVVAS